MTCKPVPFVVRNHAVAENGYGLRSSALVTVTMPTAPVNFKQFVEIMLKSTAAPDGTHAGELMSVALK